MMKRACLYLLFTLCFSIIHAGYQDDARIDDGEYEGYVWWSSSDPPLTVDGGGAVRITVENHGLLMVQSTTPLGWLGGVEDIVMDDDSILNYFGGETEELIMYENSTAYLFGGSIDGITSRQNTTTAGTDSHIELYCQIDSVSWISEDPLLGIQGLWRDGTPFYIEFNNDPDYDPVWTNINIMPEPATLVLLGLGGLVLRKGNGRQIPCCLPPR